MTLVSSIIIDAYRESNMVALDRALTAGQSTEALRLLNTVLNSIYGSDAGELITDWPLGNFGRQPNFHRYAVNTDDERLRQPPINRRLIALNERAETVYLTAEPQDGSRMAVADPFARLAAFPVTLNANGRTIEGAPALLLNVSGLFREWLYRADLSAWVRISDISAVEEMPFPAKFDNMFIILLAMRLNPRYGRKLDEQSALILRQQRRDFIARYLQSQPLWIDDSLSWPFMSSQSYDQFSDPGSSNESFNSGYWNR